jgi:glycine/D-amino acid oxidase-like deaminating enzyme
MQTRRTLLTLGAAGLASACATTPPLGAPRLRLAPVNVTEERVIRVDVGLRPYRAAGFRVERETRGEKTIVHNYGHGGGGVTLSWGSAHLAVEQGYASDQSDYAVLGCGVLGLSTARLLQERGARVRLYARELSPNTTSNLAGAQWWPTSVFSRRLASEAFMDQFFAATRFSFRRFQTLVGPDYGIAWEPNFILSDRPIINDPASQGPRMREFVVNQRDYRAGEHPFRADYVRSWDTMMIETPHYLRRLEADVRRAGGEIMVRDFAHADELAQLPEQTIFNCTGLGAGALFGDEGIEPARGHLVVLEPQPEVDYNVVSEGPLYMFGRHDGIILGGTFGRGEWSLEPDPDAVARILAGHRAIFSALPQV